MTGEYNPVKAGGYKIVARHLFKCRENNWCASATAQIAGLRQKVILTAC
jgi:hypothetical protein